LLLAGDEDLKFLRIWETVGGGERAEKKSKVREGSRTTEF
jgi:hypothetical protein